jgi:hypothetical protein
LPLCADNLRRRKIQNLLIARIAVNGIGEAKDSRRA